MKSIKLYNFINSTSDFSGNSLILARVLKKSKLLYIKLNNLYFYI